MEVQEVKEQLKEIFRTVINNDKWITIHPHGEDSDDYRRIKLEEGETPKEAIERTYGKKDKISKDYKENTSHYGKKEHQEEIISLYEGLKNPNKSEARKKEDRELLEHHLKELNKYPDTSDIHFSDEETKRENKIKEIKKELNKKQPDKKEDKKEYPNRHAEILYKDLPELREKLHKARYERAKNKEKGADVSLYDKRIKEYEDKEQQLKDEMAELRDNRRSQKERYTSLIEEQKQSDTKDGGEEKKSTFKPVKGIMQSLKDDYEAGKINAKEVAKELSEANLTPYLLDDNEALEKIGVKQPDSKGEKKYNYTLTKREVEANKMLGGMADTGNYYTNGEFAIDKKYLNIKGQEPTKKEEIEKSLKNILKGDSTDRYTPVKDFEIGELKREYGKPIKVAKYSYFDEKNGFERHIYLNKKYNDLFKNFDLKFGGETEPVFAYKGKDIVGVVMPINAREQSYSKTVNNEIEEELTVDKNQLKLKIDNSKEQEMALLDELKKLITKVENGKESDMEKIENEKVDKRKLIDEVAGIMKSAGCDDEDIRTAIGKMEKIGYDDSEKSADNCGKKVKNEEPEKDEEEVKEVKEEIKEDVDNKCKNAKEDYFSKLNEIYNAASKVQEKVEYTSRADREKAAEEYFAR